MDATTLFLVSHSVVHSAAVGGDSASVSERTFRGTHRRADAGSPGRRSRLAGVDQVAYRAHGGHHPEHGTHGSGSGIRRRLEASSQDHAPGFRHRHDERRGLGAVQPDRRRRPARLPRCRRPPTREIVGGFNARDWEGEIAVASLERAATQGAFGTRRERYVKAFTGRPPHGDVERSRAAPPVRTPGRGRDGAERRRIRKRRLSDFAGVAAIQDPPLGVSSFLPPARSPVAEPSGPVDTSDTGDPLLGCESLSWDSESNHYLPSPPRARDRSRSRSAFYGCLP